MFIGIQTWANPLYFILFQNYLDNVCIESMTVKISRKTIDKCQTALDIMDKKVKM